MVNLSIPLCKEEWLARTSRINYWNTDKPVCFVLSYVLSITQHYKQKTARKASLQSILIWLQLLIKIIIFQAKSSYRAIYLMHYLTAFPTINFLLVYLSTCLSKFYVDFCKRLLILWLYSCVVCGYLPPGLYHLICLPSTIIKS